MAAGATKSVKHSAPGPYLGFGLQPIRMCYHLLTAPEDSKVSMEHADDVAIHYSDGTLVLEQTKNALSQNPLSNWSKDLWKTLANWLDSTEVPKPGEADIRYRLFVVPEHTGEFAGAMHAAKTQEDVEAFVARVEGLLAELPRKPACNKYVKRFLTAKKEEQFHLISNLSIESNTDDPIEAIRVLFRLTIAPKAIDTICTYAVGLAKEKAEELMRLKAPAILDAGVFVAEIRDVVAKTNLPSMLPTFSLSPDTTKIKSTLAGKPNFVRQLDLIDASLEQQIRAVSDYLRASADKTSWAEAGMVFPNAFQDWEAALLGQHAAIKNEVSIVNRDLDAKSRGQLLFSKCSQVKRALDGREVADHFIHGSFQDLSERKVLGWHDDFIALLEKEDR